MIRYISEPALRRQKLKEAAAWLDQRSDKSWSQQQEEMFQLWLSSSARAKTAYNQVASTWNDPLLSEALQKPVFATKRHSLRSVWVSARVTAIAASLALVVYGVGYLKPVTKPVQISQAEISAGNVHKIVLLSDDTQVDMNVGTRAKVSYRQNLRALDLQNGEIFLDVTPDKNRPFEVRTPHGKILVTGTRFNVNATRQQLVVSVRHGSVQVESPFKEKIDLTIGQSIRVRNGTLGPVTKIALTSIDGWRHPWLETNGITIGELSARLETEHNIEIGIATPSLRQLTVSGRFSTADPRELLTDLGLIHGFQVLGTNEKITINR